MHTAFPQACLSAIYINLLPPRGLENLFCCFAPLNAKNPEASIATDLIQNHGNVQHPKRPEDYSEHVLFGRAFAESSSPGVQKRRVLN